MTLIYDQEEYPCHCGNLALYECDEQTYRGYSGMDYNPEPAEYCSELLCDDCGYSLEDLHYCSSHHPID